jgi:hypothetical protein
MGLLTVSIKEELTLNGLDRGSLNTVSISGVTQSFNRIVTCPANGGAGTTETAIAVFRDLVTTSDGAINDADAKYTRVTNLDSTNSVSIALQLAVTGTASASKVIAFSLEPGKSLILNKVNNGVGADDDGTAVPTLEHVEKIIAEVRVNSDIQVEVFIAS